MDFNLVIALNLMVVSAVALGMTLLHRPSGWLGWVGVHLLVLMVGGAAVLWWPDRAALATAVVFGPLVAGPMLLANLARRAAAQDRHTLAERLWTIAGWLHPDPARHFDRQLAEALDHPTSPQIQAALKALAARAPASRQPYVQAHLGIEQDDWSAVLAAVRDPAAPAYELKGMEIRALGELGRLDEMIALYERVKTRLFTHISEAQLFMFAFSGRQAAVEALLAGPLRSLPVEARVYWRAIAARANNPDDTTATAMLTGMAESAARQRTRRAAARQLQQALPAVLSPASSAILDAAMARRTREASRPPVKPLTRLIATPLLIAINLAMFAWAEWRGGSEELRVLFDLGALWPPAITRQGEWWRFASASVLHLGPIHLVGNMLVLVVLGRSVESRHGWVLMLALFAWCGIGSMVAVYGAMRGQLIEEGLLVGASGAIMGLLGVLAADILITWLRSRDTLDRSRLTSLLFILILQAAIDMSIPNVSFAAHGFGFLLGFVAGLLLALRTRQPT